MNIERQKKLLNYLYPTENVRKFLCNDLYQEFDEILNSSLCISSKNIVSKTRRENYLIIKNEVTNFFNNNPIYCEKIAEMLKVSDFSSAIDDIIIGYVLYLSCSIRKYNRIDIFLDKKSICYSPISVIDLL